MATVAAERIPKQPERQFTSHLMGNLRPFYVRHTTYSVVTIPRSVIEQYESDLEWPSSGAAPKTASSRCVKRTSLTVPYMPTLVALTSLQGGIIATLTR